MNRSSRAPALAGSVLASLVPSAAGAFCGFYVAGAAIHGQRHPSTWATSWAATSPR